MDASSSLWAEWTSAPDLGPPPTQRHRSGLQLTQFGTRVRVTDWECCMCWAINKIDDHTSWFRGRAEECKVETCEHKRCKDCINLDITGIKVQYCDGRVWYGAVTAQPGPVDKLP